MPPRSSCVGLLPPLLYAAAIRTLAGRLPGQPAPDRVPLGRAGDLHGVRRGSGDLVAAAGAASRRRSPSAPSWHHRTPSRPRPSRAGSACPAVSSRILEGESLVNDATALVCSADGHGRAGRGLRQRRRGGPRLPPGRAGRRPHRGGRGVGWSRWSARPSTTSVTRHRRCPSWRPFVAYLPAEELRRPPGSSRSSCRAAARAQVAAACSPPSSRLSERINWRTIQFLLENAVFLLIGLQVRWIVADVEPLGPRPPGRSSPCAWPCSPPSCCCGRSGSSRSRFLAIRPGPAAPAESPPWRTTAIISWAGHARGGDARGGVRPARGHAAARGPGAHRHGRHGRHAAAARVRRCPGWPAGWRARTRPARGRASGGDRPAGSGQRRAAPRSTSAPTTIDAQTMDALRQRVEHRVNIVWERLGSSDADAGDAERAATGGSGCRCCRPSATEVLRIRDAGAGRPRGARRRC